MPLQAAVMIAIFSKATVALLPLKGLWPILSPVQDGSDPDLISLDYVGSNVGSAGNGHFERTGHSSRSAGQRKIDEAVDAFPDPCCHFTRSGGAVLRNVISNGFKVGNCRRRPKNLHFGAGDSFSVPQLSSHSITRSFEIPLPASNSVRPARMCLCSGLLRSE